jgi:hypothetical protein
MIIVISTRTRRGGEGALGADHVVVEAADQRAGLRPHEERDRLALDVREHLRAQVVDQALPHARRVPALRQAQHGLQQRQPGHPQGEVEDQVLPCRHDAPVDDRLEQQRVGHHDQRGQRVQREEQHQLARVGAGVSRDPPHRSGLQLLVGDRSVTPEGGHHLPAVARHPRHPQFLPPNLPRSPQRPTR